MPFSRRDFIRTAGLTLGVAALPAWAYEAQTAAFLGVNKDALADTALATAKKLGASYADIRINRYRRRTFRPANARCSMYPAGRILALAFAF